MVRARAFIVGVVVAFLVTLWLADGLRIKAFGDEKHFHETSAMFAGGFPLESLRTYPEVVTPLALVIWGELDHFLGDGLFYGRLLNFVLTFAMVCLVALCAPAAWPRPALAALGLLLFPYTLPLAVRLYTDPLGAFLVVAGTIALARGRAALGWLAFVLAVATRQYLVQIPAALVAVEGLHWLRGERVRWRDVAACVASGLTVFGWVTFFGGLAPQAGIEFWTPLYPAPMLRASEFILEQGLFALTGIGAYFVVIEAVLFRRRLIPAEMQGWLGVALVIGLAVLFYAYPPVLPLDHPGGPVGRAARLLLPPPDYDWARVALFYVPAILCVLRFAGRPLDVGFWLVAAAFVLATKQQVPWEKYLYPTLAGLWTLVALGRLSGYGATANEGGENGFTKQALPRSGLST